MPELRHCANCKAPLGSDQPGDCRYCAKCTAAWQKGPTPPWKAVAVEGIDEPPR